MYTSKNKHARKSFKLNYATFFASHQINLPSFFFYQRRHISVWKRLQSADIIMLFTLKFLDRNIKYQSFFFTLWPSINVSVSRQWFLIIRQICRIEIKSQNSHISMRNCVLLKYFILVRNSMWIYVGILVE